MIVHRRGIEAPIVALTFDDGPSEWTEPILDVLAAHGAHATFFVVGSSVEGRESTLRRIVRERSEIGNHTFNHCDLQALPDDESGGEIGRTSLLVEFVAGVAPRYFRAPYLRMRPGSEELPASYGLVDVRASIVPADWEWPAETTVAHVLGRVEPGDVVVLHDGPPGAARGATVEAAASILAGLTARGMRAVTVSELLSWPSDPIP